MLVRMEMASKKYCGMSVAVAETAVAASLLLQLQRSVASSSLGARAAAASAAIVRKTERNGLAVAASSSVETELDGSEE